MVKKVAGLIVALGALGCGSDTSAIEPTLASIQENVFEPTCATSGCHNTAIEANGMLDLSSVAKSREMVGKAAVQPKAAEEGLVLVVAGKPADSFLIDKIKTNDYGTRMPSGAERLPEDVIAAVEQWITDGAK